MGEWPRLVRDQAPWEMRTERPVIRLPPWHPLLCPLASHSYLPPPPQLPHRLLCGLLPTSPATLGPERRRGGKTQLTEWRPGQCCLHAAQGGPRRPELAARPPLRGSLGVTGPWGVTGDAGTWHGSSRDPLLGATEASHIPALTTAPYSVSLPTPTPGPTVPRVEISHTDSA